MRRRRAVRWAVPALVLSLVFPATALAVNLMSAGGFLFDIQDVPLHGGFGYGELQDGTSDAYDGIYYLTVNGTRYMSSGPSTMDGSGRTVTLPEVDMGGLRVQRIVHVPSTGGDWARYLDLVSNPGAAAMTVRIGIEGNLGSDSSTSVLASSSGDISVSTADVWFTTDDTDGGGDPSLGHVVSGTSPRVAPTVVETNATVGGFASPDNLRWEYSTSIPAGGRAAILTFAIQKRSQADAQSEARELAEAPDEALAGLDDYLDDIINFSISRPGAPRVRFSGPFEADEGSTVEIGVMVTDPEGDSTTFSWDLDGDGTFGEMPGVAMVSVRLGDGPGTGTRVGISASDGTNVTERFRSISVNNVAPVITSEPTMMTTGVGARWRYQIEATDPAGVDDPLTYEIARGPERMTVSESGLVQWIPRDLDVTLPGETISAEFRVSDDDEGTTTQTYEIVVLPNRVPGPPDPLWPVGGVGLLQMPRLVTLNAQDPDRDPLTYRFQLDRVDTFDSPDLLESGSVPEGPAITEWPVASPLGIGRWHWRVLAADETLESEWAMDSFFIVPDPSMLPDAGPGGDPDGGGGGGDAGTTKKKDGGCSAGGAGAGTGSPWALLAMGLALVYAARPWRTRKAR